MPRHKTYIALKRLWYSPENRIIEAGEEVSLSHLDPGIVNELVAMGTVEVKTVSSKAKAESESEDENG